MVIVNKRNTQIADMIAFLAKIGLSAQECALAEKYLSGDVGDEVLDQLQRIDFSAKALSSQIRNDLDDHMKGLAKADRRAVCIRLFDVLFAIGHGSCDELISGGLREQIEAANECALYKRLILFMGKHGGFVDQFSMECIGKMAQGDPDKLRASIDFLRGEEKQYLSMVMTVYFWMKYAGNRQLAAEDAALMKEYEEVLLEGLNEWLQQQFYFGHDRIVSAVRANKLTREMLDLTAQCSFTEDARRQLCRMGSMAYLHFQYSKVLRDVARICLSVDVEWVLLAFAAASKEKISNDGGDYDELFWIEPDTYIRWAAVEGYPQILKRQLEKNQGCYLNAIDRGNYTTCFAKNHSNKSAGENWIDATNMLKDVLKEENPRLYEQIDAARPYYDKMIRYLVKDTPHAELAREYLWGHCKLSDLYPYEDEFDAVYISYEYMHGYQRHCNDQGFFDRCKAYMVLTCSTYTRVVEKGGDEVEQVDKFFRLLDEENMDIAHQLKGFTTLYKADNSFRGCKAEPFVKGTVNAFARYLDGGRREETLAAFASAEADGRYLALLVMRKDTARNKQEILSYASDSARLVREELLDILCGQKDWLDAVKGLLEAKKTAQRELAARVLTRWQQEGGGYNEMLLQAIKKEKNAKVLTMLQGALDIQEGGSTRETLSVEELVRQLNKGNKKKSLEWAYQKPFSPVHRTSGEVVSEAYLQAVLLCYVSQETNGVSKNAQILVKDLDFNTAEFAGYVNELFDRWLAAGAEARKRWVLYAASIHGGEEIVHKLQHQIQEWPQAARGAIAAEAVKALALNPSPRALLFVDGIARKFKFRQVKAAAQEALEFAAAELGITREELSDRIVPDFGFDENMERTYDYGARIFKVVLTPALDIEVYDENGKKLKNLSAPGKKDDAAKAAAACAEFKEMKKQMKAAVASQKARLEYALSVKREWSADAWKNLFIRNPLMHQFAIGLIWGIYEGGSLVQSFRYMEDGSFNTQDEEEYGLPKDAYISLVHPMELTDKDKQAWKEQLADYDIIQPIAQLEREVYDMTEEEADSKALERFGGCIVNDLTLNGKLTGLGWYRGSVQDAGVFNTYYREDTELGIGVELRFSGAYVGGLGEDVTIYDACFYKAGTVARGSYVYDEPDGGNVYHLKEIPKRYFSEIVLQLATATASSEKRNENWRKEAQGHRLLD